MIVGGFLIRLFRIVRTRSVFLTFLEYNPKKSRHFRIIIQKSIDFFGIVSFPKSFMEAYPVSQTFVITPENYTEFLL